jgi:hypothetical protein
MSKNSTPKNIRRPLMISWDNPSNYKRMIRQLKKHGRVRKSEPKTTVALTPRGSTDWRRVRRTIVSNLHPSRGNAMYANLNSGRAFQYGRSTGYKWRSIA